MATGQSNAWPELDYKTWKPTYETLHRILQIVGKFRTSKAPWLNHSWHSALYVSSRGFTTSAIPDGDRNISVEVDLISSTVEIKSSDGFSQPIGIGSEPISEFFAKFQMALSELQVTANFDPHPNELPDAIPFFSDRVHRIYDPSQACVAWHVFVRVSNVLEKCRAEFMGKSSPVHFFWGSFDLALTRFSGRRAPEHPGGVLHLSDLVVRDAYSHEVSSCGFWPGNEIYPHAAFYSYAYPAPAGFKDAPLKPDGAFFHESMQEFILPYELVRAASHPDQMVTDFYDTTFAAAASLGQWNRELLSLTPYLKTLQEKSMALDLPRKAKWSSANSRPKKT
jgi:hypothetical protein